MHYLLSLDGSTQIGCFKVAFSDQILGWTLLLGVCVHQWEIP